MDPIIFKSFLSFILGIYLLVKEKYVVAAVIISFTPFIRPEGLIFMGMYAIFFAYIKQWKAILWLATGHVFYSLAGYPLYQDLLWIFTQNPNAILGSQYNTGDPFHFFIQMTYILGIPLYALLWLGVVRFGWKAIKDRASLLPLEVWMVYGCFGAYFLAHTLFNYFGLFKSMGMNRVFIGVMPLMALIILRGFNFLTEELKLLKNPKLRRGFQGAIILYLIIFPFTSNPAAIDWNRDLTYGTDQQVIFEVVDGLTQKDGFDPNAQKFFYSHPFLSQVLDIDHFDRNQRLQLLKGELKYHLEAGDLIIWDHWFSVVEDHVPLEFLEQHPKLEKVQSYQKYRGNILVQLVVFKAI